MKNHEANFLVEKKTEMNNIAQESNECHCFSRYSSGKTAIHREQISAVYIIQSELITTYHHVIEWPRFFDAFLVAYVISSRKPHFSWDKSKLIEQFDNFKDKYISSEVIT